MSPSKSTKTYALGDAQITNDYLPGRARLNLF